MTREEIIKTLGSLHQVLSNEVSGVRTAQRLIESGKFPDKVEKWTLMMEAKQENIKNIEGDIQHYKQMLRESTSAISEKPMSDIQRIKNILAVRVSKDVGSVQLIREEIAWLDVYADNFGPVVKMKIKEAVGDFRSYLYYKSNDYSYKAAGNRKNFIRNLKIAIKALEGK